MLICAILLTRIEYNKSIVLVAAGAVAFLNWLLVRNRNTDSATATTNNAAP
jgi:hypothetical protein